MPRIEVSKIIHADKKHVYDIIRNMESFPEFMRDVKKVMICPSACHSFIFFNASG